MDDVLIHGPDQQSHDTRLDRVLKQLHTAGLTLSEPKCQFSALSITFLGHIIDGDGVKADPRKTVAIRDFPLPVTITELALSWNGGQTGEVHPISRSHHRSTT